MKIFKNIIRMLASILFFLPTYAQSSYFGHKSFLSPRSQGIDAARELVGWQPFINRYGIENPYGAFSVTAQYNHTFKEQSIAEYFFGCSCLNFSGSRVAVRGTQDILADYFGLPADFKSTVCFSPVVQNFLVDFNWYIGFKENWYFRIHSPLTYTSWNLRLCETIQDPGIAFHPAGYMAPVRVERNELQKSVAQAFARNNGFGDVKEPLCFGRIECAQTLTRLADIEMALGYNFCNEENYFVGINLRLIAPTGNASTGRFLFEPVVGNGRHWALGFGASASYAFWRHEIDWDENYWAFYIDFNLTHLFASLQRRSYDFIKNGPGSRYMLLEEFGDQVNLFLGNPATSAINQYARAMVPAINKTTLCSKIRINVQADLVFKLSYQNYYWAWDFGYNFWARSRECLVCRQPFPSNKYGVKGDAQVYGFDDSQNAQPLNVTQSIATLHAGQGDGNPNFANANADNPIVPVFVPVADALDNLNNDDIVALGIGPEQINGSNQAILLQDSDINNCSGIAPRAISHKLFTHFNYQWADCERYIPFLGVGAEVEFGGSCLSSNNALSQWGLWLKGGIAY